MYAIVEHELTGWLYRSFPLPMNQRRVFRKLVRGFGSPFQSLVVTYTPDFMAVTLPFCFKSFRTPYMEESLMLSAKFCRNHQHPETP